MAAAARSGTVLRFAKRAIGGHPAGPVTRLIVNQLLRSEVREWGFLLCSAELSLVVRIDRARAAPKYIPGCN